MGNMKTLTKTGRLHVSEEFLDGTRKLLVLDDNCVGKSDITIDYTDLKVIITDCIKSFKKYDTSMDAFLAPKIHKSLRIDRRVASDKSMWHYISVAETPNFVRHRWNTKKSGLIDKRRFLGGLGHNAVARLWWGAEMTVQNGNNYACTNLLFGNQDLHEAIHGRAFWQYPAALFGFLNVVGNETGVITRMVAKNFNHIITTVVLESMSLSDVENILKELLKQAKEN